MSVALPFPAWGAMQEIAEAETVRSFLNDYLPHPIRQQSYISGCTAHLTVIVRRSSPAASLLLQPWIKG